MNRMVPEDSCFLFFNRSIFNLFNCFDTVEFKLNSSVFRALIGVAFMFKNALFVVVLFSLLIGAAELLLNTLNTTQYFLVLTALAITVGISVAVYLPKSNCHILSFNGAATFFFAVCMIGLASYVFISGVPNFDLTTYNPAELTTAVNHFDTSFEILIVAFDLLFVASYGLGMNNQIAD